MNGQPVRKERPSGPSSLAEPVASSGLRDFAWRQVRTGPMAGIFWPVYQWFEVRRWRAGGQTGPTPHAIKQSVVLEYARRHRLSTLIETGTYLGDMVWAMRHKFDEIHSIELDPALAGRARKRFARYKHITIHEGDSAVMLPQVARTIGGPALFWLDGHYSGGITAKSTLETPIAKELRFLLKERPQEDAILIDDARMFVGDGDYPTVDEIGQWTASAKPRFRVQVANDVIRIDCPT